MKMNLKSMFEGATKRGLEDEIESMCTCDGGASLTASEHDKDCPAKARLIELGMDESLTEMAAFDALRSAIYRLAPMSKKKKFEIEKLVKEFEPKKDQIFAKKGPGYTTVFYDQLGTIDPKKLLGITESTGDLSDRLYNALKDFPEFKSLGMDQQGDIIGEIANLLLDDGFEESVNPGMPSYYGPDLKIVKKLKSSNGKNLMIATDGKSFGIYVPGNGQLKREYSTAAQAEKWIKEN